MCLLVSHIFSLVKCLFKSFAHFLSGAGHSLRPEMVTPESWRSSTHHGARGPLSFLPCLWNVQKLTPGIFPILLLNWVRQRWDAEPRLAPEGTEPPGLTLQVGAVRQDGHYVTYSESWNSGARKPMLCARCFSSNWLNPNSNLYHTDLIEVSSMVLWSNCHSGWGTQRLMTLLSQIRSALPSKARPAILHVSRSWLSGGQTLNSTWRSWFPLPSSTT